MLGEIIVIGSESGQVFRTESIFPAAGISSDQAVAIAKHMINADIGLIGVLHFIARVEVVVAIHARAKHRRSAHHGHATSTRHHGAGVWPRNVFLQKHACHRIDHVVWNFVAREWITNDLRVGGTYRLGGIETRVGMGAQGIVDGGAAHTEIAHRLHVTGHSGNHGVCFGVAKAFIVQEEKCLAVAYGTTQRCSKIILDQMIVSHGVEAMSIQSAVAHEFINRSVEMTGAGAGHDVDLSAACSAEFR